MHRYKRVTCKDGFSMSVQANANVYCIPRMNYAPKYLEVEIGFISEKEELLMAYCDEPDQPMDTVYGYVPVGVVALVIAKHGGMVDGEVPPGVAELRAPK